MDRLAQQRLKKEIGLPSATKYLGYVLNRIESDEYLADYRRNGIAEHWAWTGAPHYAKRYKDLKQIRRIQQGYKKGLTGVCYLFETPDQFLVYPVEEGLTA